MRDRLSAHSWSRSSLSVVAALVLVAGVGLSAGLGALRSTSPSRPRPPERLPFVGGSSDESAPDPERWLDPRLADESTDFADVLDAIPWLTTEPARSR